MTSLFDLRNFQLIGEFFLSIPNKISNKRILSLIKARNTILSNLFVLSECCRKLIISNYIIIVIFRFAHTNIRSYSANVLSTLSFSIHTRTHPHSLSLYLSQANNYILLTKYIMRMNVFFPLICSVFFRSFLVCAYAAMQIILKYDGTELFLSSAKK